MNEDNTLVLAGAGSGKTLTISAKVKYLVEQLGVHPDEILLISFTRKSSTILLETYSYFNSSGMLIEKLGEILRENAVAFKQVDMVEL